MWLFFVLEDSHFVENLKKNKIKVIFGDHRGNFCKFTEFKQVYYISQDVQTKKLFDL